MTSTAVFAVEENSPILEEIKVTATRTGTSNMQETPLAVTAVDGKFIDNRVITDLRDIGPLVPGLMVGENTGAAQLYIRGVGSNNVFAGSEPSVGLYVDGVYVARPIGMLSNFLDVERIEVLRGPQGDVYGRNATGGAINIISRTPDLQTTSVRVQAGYGTYNQATLDGAVGGPLIKDKLAASVSAQYSAHDGYRENIVDGVPDVDTQQSFSIRGQLLVASSDRLRLLVRGDYTRERYIPYGYHAFLEPVAAPLADSLFDDYSRVAHNFASTGQRDGWGTSLEIEWTLSDAWSVTSLASLRGTHYRLELDTDGTELDLIRSFLEEQQQQFSEELTLRGDLGGVQLLVGAYFFDEDNDMAGSDLRLIAAGFSRRPAPVLATKATALYANVSYVFSERLSADFGLRYSRETKDYEKHDGLFTLDTMEKFVELSFEKETITDSVTTPKLGLNYKVSEDFFLYAKATRGFKSGGFNFTAAERGGFQPETLWAYEIGSKISLADNRIHLNSALFHYDYNDLQVQAFIVPGTADITNAASATVSGAELELRAAVTDSFELSGYIAYLDADYEDYPEAPIAGGGSVDASGNALNNAPTWSASFAAIYRQQIAAGTLFLEADLSWVTDIFFTVDNNAVETQRGYALVNMSARYEWADGRYAATLWARNIFDQHYVNGSAAFPPSRAGRAGAPATFGVRLSFRH